MEKQKKWVVLISTVAIVVSSLRCSEVRWVVVPVDYNCSRELSWWQKAWVGSLPNSSPPAFSYTRLHN